MKKCILTCIAALTLIGFCDAAVPQDGYYLDKNGIPLTESQEIPPKVKTSPMPAMPKAVYDAMALLPHSANTVIRVSVDDYGNPVSPVVSQSAGSVILDEYALTAVNGWTFTPAMRGEKAMTAQVSIPIRFTSTMVLSPAVPKDMSFSNQNELALWKNKLKDPVSVTVFVTQEGKVNGDVTVTEVSSLSKKENRELSKFLKQNIEKWTFTPAVNPDGENISQELTFPITL